MKIRRALVVGATGFLGGHLVDELIARGVEVRATRRRQSFTVLLRRRAIELASATLDDVAALGRAMSGCDVVFFAAGHYPRYSLDRDDEVALAARGVRAVCDAALASGVRRLVVTSSTGALAPAPYGRAADERDIGASPPATVYGAVKWTIESELDAARARGLDATSILAGGFLGPGDVRVGTTAFLAGIVRGEMPWLVDGVVHVIDVSDVARAHVDAAELDGVAPRYCLPGHTLRAAELFRRVADRYDGRMPPVELCADEARVRADRDEERAAPTRGRVAVPRALVDIVTSGQPIARTLAERDLAPRLTPIEVALDRTYVWFRDNGYLRGREHEGRPGAA